MSVPLIIDLKNWIYTNLFIIWEYILPRNLHVCKEAINILLKTGYYNEVEKQVAFSQHQCGRLKKECMLHTGLCLLGGKSHRSVFSFEFQRFFLRFAATMISERFVKLSIIADFSPSLKI